MDFDETPQEASFRDEVRTWLAEHLVGEFADLVHSVEFGPEDWDVRVAWERELGRGGWIGLSWPKAVGGRDVSVMEELIFAQEYARASGPLRAGHFGERLLGPTLIGFGTEEQRTRFLPPILRGEEFWCQGFSEPNSGSDLASVSTRGRLDGDGWHVDGQKVWTSQAQFADWIFVLCRTEPEAPSHQALSYLLVPVDQPGVERRPLVDLAGSPHFCEVFFDDATTAADLVVGGRGNGWKTAMGTLGFERGSAMLAQQLGFAREFDAVAELAADRGRLADPVRRDRLARAYSELEIMRYNGLRTVTAYVNGVPPGPEAAFGKLYWSQWHQRFGELQVDLLGADAMLDQPSGALEHELVHAFLFSRAHTIYAGSSEIQRNIIGERVLGLPRS